MVHPRSVYWRRRAVAIAILVALVALPFVAFGRGGDEPSASDDTARAPETRRDEPTPIELPRGGRRIFPDFRVVGFYGAPQDDELGVLGIGKPSTVARKLERVAKAYARKTRPALPAFELLATVAAADPGADGKYILRQDDATIERYLKAARRAKALLVLDIQPGHADFMTEARKLEKWLREPDVSLALDPEWHTPGATPGSVIGSVSAEKVNEVGAWLSGIVRERRLPEKLYVLHQFTADMIKNKERVKKYPGLAVTFNVDGFGDRPNKRSKYNAFTREAVRFHDGFKLFYREDTNLMKPRQVLALQPPPDFVVYE